MIPLSIPNFEGNEKLYVDRAIEQTWVSTGGAYIEELEERLAEFIGAEQVAVCQSGTAALHLSLLECGIQPGDVVIVPTLTFIAAVNPVKYQFAEPVFMDCDDSLCMDPIKLRLFCEEECHFNNDQLTYKGKHVKALIVVHVFGNMADMETLMEIAHSYHLQVIEDATEALGTRYLTGRYAGKYAGTIGDYGAFSFNGNKIITTGGGGAVTARSKAAVEHMRYLSTQSKDDSDNYIHSEIGYNYRMTNLQAALGVAQMEELPEFIRRKQANYTRYQQLLHGSVLCELLPFRKNTYSNQWFYSLRINRDEVKASVGEVIDAMKKRKIQMRPIWGLIHEQKPYRNSEAYCIEKAKAYSESVLNIPSSTNLKEDEIQCVVDAIEEVIIDLS